MAGAIAYLDAGSAAITRLRAACQAAEEDGRSLRIETGTSRLGYDERNWVKFKVGEGPWSPPLYEDEDPNRDG